MNIRKAVFLLLLIALFLTCGFLRDFVFLAVNEQTRIAYYHSPDSFLPHSMKFLEPLSYSALYYLKWLLTLVFAMLFMGLTIAFVYLFFPNRTYLSWTLYVYGGVMALAGVFWLGGYLVHSSEKGYIISRFLMGLEEGPVMLMLLIPGFRLFEISNRMKGRNLSK
jgi:hypothetical protein